MPIYITEYYKMGEDSHGTGVSAGLEPNVAEQQLTISGTSAQAAVFNASTSFIMVHTTEACCIQIAINPTAVNNRHRLAAGETRFYALADTGLRLAGITTT